MMAQTYLNSSFPLTTNTPQANKDWVITILDMVFNCGLLHCLSVSGVLANIINILILSKYGLRETTSLLLFSLSVSDLFCSLLQPIRRLHCIVAQFDSQLANNMRSFTVVYFFPMPDIFVSISILHTTVIAVERLVAVCSPLRVSRIFTPRRVKGLLLFIYLYVIVLMAPTLFLFDFFWTLDPSTNRTTGVFTLTQFYKSSYDSMNQYMNMGLTNLLVTFTLAVTIICSIVIGYKITVGRKSTLVQLSSSVSKEVKDMKVIKMLLTVCVVNACVSLPTVTINLFLLYSNTLIQSSGKLYYLLRSFIIVLYQLNASINFIIYISMSSKFASTLNKLCLCKNKTNNK
ncbi:thyrotropin-releasing hormone receptor [Biomphalaria pfeifferi]|uniref:Thyrotropin-releasing hormone receptor n=1 Tax=Biomphalaria pfeifferi TaxID=112525 RepID=A0AAD8F238_BIOPF|nr:thyrotropin-releasing hormone receptor [Biomphalaria pfeifferi]